MRSGNVVCEGAGDGLIGKLRNLKKKTARRSIYPRRKEKIWPPLSGSLQPSMYDSLIDRTSLCTPNQISAKHVTEEYTFRKTLGGAQNANEKVPTRESRLY
jgi:hypothetical protein